MSDIAATKITIVLPNLYGGGAERLAITLANDWQRRGYAVEFILLKKEGELLSLVSKNIKLFGLGTNRIRHSVIPLMRYFKSSNPGVIWVSLWPLTASTIISWILAGRPGKLFVTDHIQLSIACLRELKISLLWPKITMKTTYRFATGVNAVSRGVAADIACLGAENIDKIKVIYNPAAKGISANRASPVLREKLWGGPWDFHILAIGSFKPQKNHPLLIRAFAKVAACCNAKLVILGEGYLRNNLENQIAKLNLSHRVELPGFILDPTPWLNSADLFVLTSSWEGFGNVLVEALECGLPVVSTDCPSGPAEILDYGRFGDLVPVDDEVALANAIVKNLRCKHDYDVLKNRSKEFSVEKISLEYLRHFGLFDRE